MWTKEQLMQLGGFQRKYPLKGGIPFALDILEDPRRIPYLGRDREESDSPDFVLPLNPINPWSKLEVERYVEFLREVQRGDPLRSDSLLIIFSNLHRPKRCDIGRSFLNMTTTYGPTGFELSCELGTFENKPAYSASFREDITPYHLELRKKYLGH